MKKPVMGIQLYTLRDHIQNAEDFDSTLERLAGWGVKDVQISAIGDIPAQIQADILKKHGMSVCVTHKPFERMLDDLDALISEHKAIDCDALGLGAPSQEYRGSTANVLDFIAKANGIAAKLAGNGMTFNYHNHDFEFKKLDDRDCCMMDMLIENASDSFRFIPDVAWIHYGGSDPVEVMRRMKGKIKVIHFKDYVINAQGGVQFVSLGKGLVDLKACYDFACENEIPYIVFEQDRDWVDDDPFISCEESWQYLCGLNAQ